MEKTNHDWYWAREKDLRSKVNVVEIRMSSRPFS